VSAGSFAWNRGSTRTEPVKFSAGPFREGTEPLRVILIVCESCIGAVWGAPDPSAVPAGFAWAEAEASRESNMTVAANSFIL
jgi:hypothetical protein